MKPIDIEERLRAIVDAHAADAELFPVIDPVLEDIYQLLLELERARLLGAA